MNRLYILFLDGILNRHGNIKECCDTILTHYKFVVARFIKKLTLQRYNINRLKNNANNNNLCIQTFSHEARALETRYVRANEDRMNL